MILPENALPVCLEETNSIALALLPPLELLLINCILLALYALRDIRYRLLGLDYALFLALPVQEHELVHRDGCVRE